MRFKKFALLYLFLGTLISYILLWKGMEHLRLHNGPWVVNFRTDTNSTARLTINNHKKGITNAVISIANIPVQNTIVNKDVSFTNVNEELPFGKFIYHDLMFLPGVVTFSAFGNEIELMKRALIVNRKEIPWSPAPDLKISYSTNAVPVDYTNVPEPITVRE